MFVVQCQVCHKQAMIGDGDEVDWLEIRRMGDSTDDAWHLCPTCQKDKEAVLTLCWDGPPLEVLEGDEHERN